MIDIRIEAKEILVKDLFDSKFLFRIPEYQRPFSWETENFEQLFDDINQAMESGEENYFLGSVILQIKKLNSDGSGIYDIVDGQQRLTTLTILLSVMRDLTYSKKAKETIQDKIYQEENEFEGNKEEVRIEVRDRDATFFKKYILEEEGTKKNIKKNNLTESQLKMYTAIEVFRNKLMQNGTVNQDLLNNMIKYILNNCILVYVRTSNFTSAYRLFSVLNDRGMPLSTSDLLKSSNLGAILDKNKRKYYQNIWEQIEENLGRDELDKLLGFIRLIIIKEKAKKTIIDEYNEIIFGKDMISKGEEFIDYLKEMSDIYQTRILDATLDEDSQYKVKYYNLMSLMRDYIPFTDWMVVILSYIHKFGASDNLYFFLKNIERVYVVNWMRGVTITKRVIETSKLLHVIEKSSKEQEVFENEIFKLKQYKDDIANLIQSENFYKMKFAKYLLLRLELSMSENSNIEKVYRGIISVEHILPQNPGEKSEWKKKFTDEEREKYTNKLGNLVLLSRRKNSSANNRSFKEKLKKYFTKGITDFELTKEILKYDEWDKISIEKRQRDKTDDLIKILIG